MNSKRLDADNRVDINESKLLTDPLAMKRPDDEATVPKNNDNDNDNNNDDDDNESPTISSPLLATDDHTTRKTSLSSTSSKSSDCPDICRICHCEGTNDEPLISPCLCLGTMQYLHQSCLQRWIKSAGVKSCELCKFEFIMHSEIKPFTQVDDHHHHHQQPMCSR
jgi:hypothetical protein